MTKRKVCSRCGMPFDMFDGDDICLEGKKHRWTSKVKNIYEWKCNLPFIGGRTPDKSYDCKEPSSLESVILNILIPGWDRAEYKYLDLTVKIEKARAHDLIHAIRKYYLEHPHIEVTDRWYELGWKDCQKAILERLKKLEDRFVDSMATSYVRKIIEGGKDD